MSKDTLEERIIARKSFTKKDFSDIYEVFHKKVFDFVNRRVDTKEIAEDLTSDIFERILKSIDDFQWQGINISAWIFRIARNRIIDHYRKYSKRKKDASLDDYSNTIVSKEKQAEELLLEGEEYVYLYNALREFSEEDQYLVYYKFFEDLSNKEIAKITGLSETNIGTKLYRVRKKLNKLIKSNMNE